MSLVRVIALKDFAMNGHAVYAGQAVELLPAIALMRARDGEVSLDPQMRATYQTRDMVAVQPAPVVVPVVVESETEPPKPKTRRRRSKKPA